MESNREVAGRIGCRRHAAATFTTDEGLRDEIRRTRSESRRLSGVHMACGGTEDTLEMVLVWEGDGRLSRSFGNGDMLLRLLSPLQVWGRSREEASLSLCEAPRGVAAGGVGLAFRRWRGRAGKTGFIVATAAGVSAWVVATKRWELPRDYTAQAMRYSHRRNCVAILCVLSSGKTYPPKN